MKNWYQILTHMNNWYQIITDVKNWYLIITDVSNKTVKNWNRRMQMQLIWGGGYFYQCEEYACMLYEIGRFVYCLQSMRNWYEICDVLVPIFHML